MARNTTNSRRRAALPTPRDLRSARRSQRRQRRRSPPRPRRRRQPPRPVEPLIPIQIEEVRVEEEEEEVQQPRRMTYCGTNSLHPNAANRGTRYECLRKGIWVGCNRIPVDNTLVDMPYARFDDERVYCGNENNLPAGYTRMGASSDCFQIGVGLGKKRRARGLC